MINSENLPLRISLFVLMTGITVIVVGFALPGIAATKEPRIRILVLEAESLRLRADKKKPLVVRGKGQLTGSRWDGTRFVFTKWVNKSFSEFADMVAINRKAGFYERVCAGVCRNIT